MKFTREALSKMGITDDATITAILNAHNEILQPVKDLLETAQNEAKQAKKDLATAQSELKTTQADLKAAQEAGGGEGDSSYKEKYEAEVAAHKKTKDDHKAEKESAETAGLLKAAFLAGGANDSVVDWLVNDYLAEAKKGTKDNVVIIENAEALLTAAKAKHAGVFGKPKENPADVGGGAGGSGSPYAGKTALDLMRLANADPSKLPEIQAYIKTSLEQKPAAGAGTGAAAAT